MEHQFVSQKCCCTEPKQIVRFSSSVLYYSLNIHVCLNDTWEGAANVRDIEEASAYPRTWQAWAKRPEKSRSAERVNAILLNMICNQWQNVKLLFLSIGCRRLWDQLRAGKLRCICYEVQHKTDWILLLKCTMKVKAIFFLNLQSITITLTVQKLHGKMQKLVFTVQKAGNVNEHQMAGKWRQW